MLSLDPEKIAAFCRRHHIARLSVFGSSARGDARVDSDVDFLYIFEDGHTPGWEMADVEAELAAMVGRRIDLVSERHLNPWMARRIRSEAKVIYDARAVHAA